MKYRLLVEMGVIEFLDALPQRVRQSLRNRFAQILKHPGDCADYSAKDESGRELDVHVFQGYAIFYWDDFADRHVKILAFHNADR